MKFAVNGTHRDFYRKLRWIELEEMFSPAQQHLLNMEIIDVEAARNKTNVAGVASLTSDQLFAKGRDVWRGSAAVKKLLLSKGLAEVASELIEHKPLRFGYDQFLPMQAHKLAPASSYANLLMQSHTLQEISSMQGVLCGLMLCVQGPAPEVAAAAAAEETAPSSLFSLTPGNGVIFSPEVLIPFQELCKRQGYSYVMLVYVQAKSVYLYQEQDPLGYELKQLGYNYGDRLTDTLNPLVYV